MKEAFISKRFSPTAIDLIAYSQIVIKEFQQDGIDLTLRQLYYKLFKAGKFPDEWFDPKAGSTNNIKSYNKLKALIGDARMAGEINWDLMKDLERPLLQNPHWENKGHFIENVAPQYRINLWENQPSLLEAMVEKRGHLPILQPICEAEDIPITGNKGYSSLSAIYEAGKRMEQALSEGKRAELIYFGDHDPSGLDMSRDIFERVNVFANVLSFDQVDAIKKVGDDVQEVVESWNQPFVQVHRVALNIDQVKDRDLVPAPAKDTDSRSPKYVEQFGNKSWEIEALDAREMRQMATEIIFSLRDDNQWRKDVAKMEKDRKALIKFAKTLK